jgi:hypothetical protein
VSQQNLNPRVLINWTIFLKPDPIIDLVKWMGHGSDGLTRVNPKKIIYMLTFYILIRSTCFHYFLSNQKISGRYWIWPTRSLAPRSSSSSNSIRRPDNGIIYMLTFHILTTWLEDEPTSEKNGKGNSKPRNEGSSKETLVHLLINCLSPLLFS